MCMLTVAMNNSNHIQKSNYDYKVLAFVISHRIQKVVKSIIHTDQSAYIKGRYIGSNARYVADFHEYCEKDNLPGIILSRDMEKAYDRLDRRFL